MFFVVKVVNMGVVKIILFFIGIVVIGFVVVVFVFYLFIDGGVSEFLNGYFVGEDIILMKYFI